MSTRVIVGVAYPAYPVNATTAQERGCNARCKEELKARFPEADLRYHGRLDPKDANRVRIGFIAAAKPDVASSVAAVAAGSGKRPTLGRNFQGALLLECTATDTTVLGGGQVVENVIATVVENVNAMVGPTVQELATMKMADLVEWARILGVKVNKTGSKVDARNAITAFQIK